jgi:sporulation protein YlmC with PRC-barrel domain
MRVFRLFSRFGVSAFALGSTLLCQTVSVATAQEVTGNWKMQSAMIASSNAGAMVSSQDPIGPTSTERSLIRANQLTDSNIYYSHGEVAGHIMQVALDRALDRVAYLVVAVEREPSKEVGVPLSALAQDDEGRLTIDIVSTELRRAPPFEKRRATDMSSDAWMAKVNRFFKDRSPQFRNQLEMFQTPVVAGREEREPISVHESPYQVLTKLIGLEVKTRNAESVGTIEDAVVDTHEGRVIYGVLSLTTLAGGEMAVVPWHALQVRPRQDIASLDASVKTLDTIAFAPPSFPNLDRAYAAKVFRLFEREPYWQVYGYVPRDRDSKSAWLSDSDFNRHFDSSRVRTVECIVQSVGTFAPEPGARDGLRLRAKA